MSNERETEIVTADSGTVAMLARGEIDMQIATAHKYPRSIVNFRNEVLQMVTLNEQIAGECIYALPRDGKTIEGPSARFAEVIASAWGNSRAGARVVSDQGEFVTAQGVFHDLQRNVAITYEVQRRIVDKHGRRFKPDMIGVTANAACSIALRNAILKGVPKAFWSEMYDAARRTVMGDIKTLANRRAEALAVFQRYGVQPDRVFAKLGVAGEQDITLEHLVVLRGIVTAIKDGDTTAEQAFSDEAANQPTSRPPLPAWTAADFAAEAERWEKAVAAGLKTADEILTLARSKGALTPEQEAQIKGFKKAAAADVTDAPIKSEVPAPQPTTAGADDSDLPWED